MLCFKAPLPMEDIEKMAEACMKDIDDDDDENLEDDEDLLVSETSSLKIMSCFSLIAEFKCSSNCVMMSR